MCVGCHQTAIGFFCNSYLERSEMNDAIDVWMRIEDFVDGSLIPHVDIMKLRAFSADQFNAIERFLGRVVEIVEDYDVVVGLEQGKGSKGTNVAGPTVNEELVKCKRSGR